MSKAIVVSMSHQFVVAYSGTQPTEETTFLVSNCLTGVPGKWDTPAGSFSVTWRSKLWRSKQYDGAPMPWAVCFHDAKGCFLHEGDVEHRWSLLGVHVAVSSSLLRRHGHSNKGSHGCVRLPSDAAKSLYVWAERGTPVHILAQRPPSPFELRCLRQNYIAIGLGKDHCRANDEIFTRNG